MRSTRAAARRLFASVRGATGGFRRWRIRAMRAMARASSVRGCRTGADALGMTGWVAGDGMAARRPEALVILWLLLLPLALAPTAHAATSAPFAWGADLPPWWSSSAPDRAAAIAASSAAGMTLIAVDAKEEGALRYEGVRFVVQDAHAKSIRVVARYDIFEDKLAAQKFPGSAIAGGPWVDPACADVRAYALANLRALVSTTGIDEVNFDHVRYPETAEAPADARLPCTGGTVGTPSATDRVAVITSWVRDAAAEARAIRPIQVSASTFAQSITGPYASIGQDSRALAPHLDIVRPMLYPTYLGRSSAPYETVHEWTTKSVQAFGAAKTQPWIQSFDVYSARPDIVGLQLKALVDAGATGGLAWWFWSAGTSTSYWTTVASALPAAPPPASEASAPAPFDATFTNVKGTNRLVQTTVTANAPVAGVCAMVDGGACRALALRSGVWSAKTHVATGATVVFRATDASGRTDDSGGYLWPSATPSAPAPSPAPSAPSATFTPYDGNDWWVQTRVASEQAVRAVCARLDGGACQPLAPRSWGAWAASLPAPAGTQVVFEATLGDGTVARSGTYTWPVR